MVAHYAIGAIGENSMVAAALGVRNLLWFEAFTFTVSTLPILVITSYMARLITLSETSIFVSPFRPEEESE